MKKSTKVLNEQFLKLQNSYNQAQSNFPALISQYTPALQEEKRALHLETGVNLYRPQFQDLLTEVVSAIRINVSDKNKLKFPLRFSDNSNDRLIGEQKLSNARLLFAEFKKSPDVLAGELQNMIDAEDRDSANSLIDIVVLSMGDARTEDMKKFNFVKDVFSQNSGINSIDSELESLLALEDQTKKVIMALTDNTPYILFGFQSSTMPDEDFFNLQNKLKDLFGESGFRKIQQNF